VRSTLCHSPSWRKRSCAGSSPASLMPVSTHLANSQAPPSLWCVPSSIVANARRDASGPGASLNLALDTSRPERRPALGLHVAERLDAHDTASSCVTRRSVSHETAEGARAAGRQRPGRDRFMAGAFFSVLVHVGERTVRNREVGIELDRPFEERNRPGMPSRQDLLATDRVLSPPGEVRLQGVIPDRGLALVLMDSHAVESGDATS